jgi:hypothetical protein
VLMTGIDVQAALGVAGFLLSMAFLCAIVLT